MTSRRCLTALNTTIKFTLFFKISFIAKKFTPILQKTIAGDVSLVSILQYLLTFPHSPYQKNLDTYNKPSSDLFGFLCNACFLLQATKMMFHFFTCVVL